MNQKFHPWKMMIVLVLAASVLLASPTAFGTLETARAQTQSEKLADLKKKTQAAQKKMEDLQDQTADTEAYLDALTEKINATEEQIEIYGDKIKTLDKDIANVTKQISEIEQEIHLKQISFDQKYEEFSQRMAALYESGAPSKIEAFLSAKDFSDFLIQAELLSNVAKQDREALNELIDQMNEIKKAQAELNEKKAKLDTQKKELETSKKELETTQKNLKADIKEANEKLETLAAQTDKATEKFFETQRQQEAVEQEIQNKINGSDYTEGDGMVTGNMRWPMPGYSSISTYFNPNGINGRKHGGIDICGGGIYGKNIVAADGGTVIVSEYHWSFGNYVMVDHHNGLVTLYAHASKLLVREGQAVSKGQTLALVGSTGNSTGPHLHFEVRKNGSRVNPFNYVSYR